MKAGQVEQYRGKALSYFKKAGIVLTTEESENIEIADFGLGDFETLGLALVTYVNNSRYCGKELILLPGQICPEHRHPPISGANPGKQETFRCRWGTVMLYVSGTPLAGEPEPVLPARHAKFLTVRKRVVLNPGG